MALFSSILSAMWFLFPAGIANMTPVFAMRIFPAWEYPLDGFATFRGMRVLGDHKTVRGMLTAGLMGEVAYLIQNYAVTHSSFFASISWVSYIDLPWYIGFCFGFGAIFGDAIKSFIKRQYDIRPGQPWIPFDQSDWILGMLLATLPWIQLPFVSMVITLSVGIVLHLLTKVIGKLLHLNTTYI